MCGIHVGSTRMTWGLDGLAEKNNNTHIYMVFSIIRKLDQTTHLMVLQKKITKHTHTHIYIYVFSIIRKLDQIRPHIVSLFKFMNI
jgi:hypothetical protein